jgi:hypothetical protein
MAEQHALYRPPRFLCGLDVGQMADPSALAILERQMLLGARAELEPRFDARWLERLPLQTSYPAMVEGVRGRLTALQAPAVLVIDATGVGRGVVDMFREGWTTSDPLTQERLTLPGKPTIIAVTLTGAEHARSERWDEWFVPKRDIVMAFMMALQQRRFRAAKGLPEAETLFKEGQSFQWKVSKAGNDLYGAWREGQHDDLLLACAIAVWWGERYAPRSLPSSQGQGYAQATGNPLRRVAGGRR